VPEQIHVAKPPGKPLLVFDDACNFCRFWVWRWQQLTGGRIDLIPFQDPQVSERFPEIPRAHFEKAVQLIELDGRVHNGAEAVFHSLAYNRAWAWLLWAYYHVPFVSPITEGAYAFVAGHRQTFSVITRLFWGSDPEVPDYRAVRWLFLRGLGLIYLAAFISFWVQINGLIGSHGILPANAYMASARQFFNAQPLIGSRYHLLPTWCWFSASDGFLQALCAAGTFAGLLLVIGIAPTLSAFALWSLYLSLTVVARDFLAFQWDGLLLEAGFLAIFLVPFQWFPRPSREPPVSRVALWLQRWLLFRLMFESGCVKLLSGDPTWRQLTALKYHYETQPLPTAIAWHAHQWPPWFQQGCVAVLFGIELGLPFFIFGPRRLRFAATVGFFILQVWILVTGNYAFFNYLTILLCVLLLDDNSLKRLRLPRCIPFRRPPLPAPPLEQDSRHAAAPPRPGHVWPLWATASVTAAILVVNLGQFASMFTQNARWSRPALALGEWLAPFRTVNSYGLFAVMTTTRPEIIIEGSNDRSTWRAYEFKCKPGPPRHKPAFIAPYQPRLDWQMWFAALGTPQQNPWFISFCVRLLQGSPEVLHLLAQNPFPETPPRYLRAVLYDYHFATPEDHRTNGAWWHRTSEGLYLPAISLEDLRSPRMRLTQ
jgi:predicted DCC family thiol-disulfide oxidoreductase YuxK